ncbi:hypothetical protein ABFS82_02G126900 [Erythranthe guttata]|nr:PREDICTED: uncharacterized protein LOC105969468 [Erythranthe guttata]|eukprot:XP_012849674.1 PREDICTED: uncharacterized protein LOC105969468 [Erythranthe guttata]
MAMIMKSSTPPPDETEAPPKISEKQQFSHFSHRHPLELSEVHEEDHAICSGCEHDIISGSAYICAKPKCNFLLHDLCFDLPRRIRHRCHPKHPLSLFIAPPYSDREFTCDACGESGHGFTYHCGSCKFDLHVECAALPETENRPDHQHPLILVGGFDPEKMVDGVDSVCYVCGGPMAEGRWIYSCLACKCGAHLDCATA